MGAVATISLDSLTQQHVNQCADQIGTCVYGAPCIIGTLMTPDQQDEIPTLNLDDESIDYLVKEGVVVMPESQIAEAKALQDAFDQNNADALKELLAKRGLRWPA